MSTAHPSRPASRRQAATLGVSRDALGSPAPSEPSPHPLSLDAAPAERVWRYEFKYIVARHVRNAILADFRPFTRCDENAGSGGGYTVRSLYLDSCDWRCFHEKADGVARRFKLRVRHYPDSTTPTTIKFEVKHRWNNRISKDIATVDPSLYRALLPALHGRHMIDAELMENMPALRAFFGLKQYFAMAPVMNVQFRRVALAAHHDPSARITFDDALMVNRARDLFQPMPATRSLLSAFACILEVKVNRDLPFWVRRIIAKYRLRLQSISKYGHAAANGSFGLDAMS